MHIRVTAAELGRNNQESVTLTEGGGYLGWLGVFHELHCIVRFYPSLSRYIVGMCNSQRETKREKSPQESVPIHSMEEIKKTRGKT